MTILNKEIEPSRFEAVFLDPDWPEDQFIDVAKNHGLTKEVHAPSDSLRQLRKFINNLSTEDNG